MFHILSGLINRNYAFLDQTYPLIELCFSLFTFHLTTFQVVAENQNLEPIPVVPPTPNDDVIADDEGDVSLPPNSANSRLTSANSRVSGRSRRAPSNRQSARFKRIPIQDKLLLTELVDSDNEDDILFSQDHLSTCGSERIRHSDVTSKKDDVDNEEEDRGANSDETELDVDIDGND